MGSSALAELTETQPAAQRTDTPKRRILFSVGDDSGDLHAANLMRILRVLAGDLEFVGFGMERMVQAGLKQLQPEESSESEMWLRNLLRLGRYRRRLEICCREMDETGVDLVIPVDFGGFNLCLCRAASQRGVPVFYYIPPQVWAHGRYRLKKLRKWVTRAGLIYPFEVPLYKTWGVPAEYVGNPLFDHLDTFPPSEHVVDWLRESFGENLIGIFPGSRRQEIQAHMPVIIDACRRIRNEVSDASFALVTPPKMRGAVAEMVEEDGPEIAILDDARPSELAGASRLCITKSGTVTLEIASQHTPMVIFYRTSLLGRFLASGMADVPWIGLINVLAGATICPEKLMSGSDSGWLAEEALGLLKDPEARETCAEAIRGALSGYAEPGASKRAARSALELM